MISRLSLGFKRRAAPHRPSVGRGRLAGRAYRPGVDAPGLAATELVVVLPIFVLILVGMVALARGVYAKIAALTTASDCAMQMAQTPLGSVFNDADQGQPIRQVERAYGLHYEVQMGTGAGQSVGWCQVAYVFRGPKAPPASRSAAPAMPSTAPATRTQPMCSTTAV